MQKWPRPPTRWLGMSGYRGERSEVDRCVTDFLDRYGETPRLHPSGLPVTSAVPISARVHSKRDGMRPARPKA